MAQGFEGRCFGRMAAILVIFLAAFGTSVWAEKAPEKSLPGGADEIARMMQVTWSQEILPAGARAETLRELLARGEVILINDHPPASPWLSAAGILVEAPPEVVYEVFTDFNRFPEYVPMCEKAVPTMVGPGWVDVEFTVAIKMAFLSYDITYSCYHYCRPEIYRADWCKHAGEFQVNSGFYQALPADGGRRSMLFYSVYSVVTSSFVKSIYAREPSLEMMTNVSTATMMVRALKQRAEEVYRRRPGYQPLPESRPARPLAEILLGDPPTLKLLAEQGKILVLEEGPTVYVTAGTVVPASAEQAFEVVSRFEAAPSYIPGVRKVEARGMGAEGPRYFWAVELNLAFLTYRYEYELEYLLTRPAEIRWQIPRQAGPAPGFWRFIPLAGGEECLIFNGATADIRAMGLVPRYALKVEPTLEHALIASQGVMTINATKERIRSSLGPAR